MSDNNIRNVSQHVEGQFPSLFKELDSLLPIFLKAYYEWCEESGNVIHDINRLTDQFTTVTAAKEFIDVLKEEFIPFVPREVFVDKRLLIRHAREFFTSRGTIDSIEYLFRISFGKTPTVFFPKENLFIPSAANWNLDQTVFFKSDSDVTRARSAIIELDGSRLFVSPKGIIKKNSNTFQFRFSTKEKIPLTTDATILLDNISYPLINTTFSVSVLNSGKGFSRGQIFAIDSASGSGSRIKVKAVDEFGGITKAELVEFGFGYQSDFITTIFPVIPQNQFTRVNNFELLGSTIVRDSQNQGTTNISDVGFITIQNYFDDGYLADNSYSGLTLSQFSDFTPPIGNEVVSDDFADLYQEASVQISVGNIGRYVGYFTDNVGFISDFSFLQDSNFYQKFSYVIKSELQRRDYEKLVYNTTHTSGFKLFSEYNIDSQNFLNVAVENILSILRIILMDFVETADGINFINTVKVLVDSTTHVDGINSIVTNKPLASNTAFEDITDTNFYDFDKLADTDTTTTDDTDYFFDTDKPLEDATVPATDTNFYDFSKLADTDAITTNDTDYFFDTDKLADTDFILEEEITDESYYDFDKLADTDAITTNDTDYFFDTDKPLDHDVSTNDTDYFFDTDKLADADTTTTDDTDYFFDTDKPLADTPVTDDTDYAIDFSKAIPETFNQLYMDFTTGDYSNEYNPDEAAFVVDTTDLLFDAFRDFSDESTTDDGINFIDIDKVFLDDTGVSLDTTDILFDAYRDFDDNITTVDTFAIGFLFEREFSDSIDLIEDETLLALNKELEEDTVVVEDESNLVFGQVSSDTLNTADMGGIEGTPYVGDPIDGDVSERRYWEYGYLVNEYTF